MSNMLDDEWIQDSLIDGFGLEGYGFWCAILELYARHCGDQPGEYCTIPMKTVRRKLRISEAKVMRLLHGCEANAKLSFNFREPYLEIKIPKMLDFKDEWTRKKKNVPEKTPESLREQNTEEQNTDNPPTPQGADELFNQFMAEYPRPTNKLASRKAWHTLKLDARFEEVMTGLRSWKQSAQWQRDNGRFIPGSKKFLDDERWAKTPTTAKTNAHMDAWKAGRMFRYEGGEIPADALIPFDPASGEENPKTPTGFKSKRTGEFGYFKEFEIA